MLGLVALLAGFALLAGCDETKTNNGEELAAIHGTVTLHGDWPTTGKIQVSLFSHWNDTLALNLAPGGPPDFFTDSLASPDPSAQSHVIPFEIRDISPGLYRSLVVGWRNGGVSGLDEPVLGLYGGDFAAGDTLPESIALEGGDDLELHFEGELDRVPDPVILQPGQVEGTVLFSDAWPTGYNAYYIVLMDSADPAVPSQPRAMEIVSSASPDFLLTLQFADTYTGHLAVYGYPYTQPFDAFFGGHGWDWDAGTPALADIVLEEGHAGIGGLVVTCRSNR
jgi:hypothetical protein